MSRKKNNLPDPSFRDALVIMSLRAHDLEESIERGMTTKKPKRYPKKLSYRHLAVMQWFFDHPDGKQYECAEALRYSPTWISRIIHSESYKAYHRRLLDTMLVEKSAYRTLYILFKDQLNDSE